MSGDNSSTSHNQNTRLAKFLKALEDIPWFANIGKPLPEGSTCKQIHNWDDWPGPEEPSVAEMDDGEAATYEELTQGEDSDQLSELHDRIQKTVVRLAKDKVPYDEEEDTCHAPTAAVWQAGWTAGLIGLCLWMNRPVSPGLAENWNWFLAGHWPCDWEGDYPDGQPTVY